MASIFTPTSREVTSSEGVQEDLRQKVEGRNELLLTLKYRIASIHAQITDSKSK